MAAACFCWCAHGVCICIPRSGAVFGVLAIHYAGIGDYRASFIAMAVTIAIDSSDGTLARYFNVKKRVPGFDGALLDNIVDYLTYVVAPVFLVIRAAMVTGTAGFAVAGFVLIASAYQFCQADAKTDGPLLSRISFVLESGRFLSVLPALGSDCQRGGARSLSP